MLRKLFLAGLTAIILVWTAACGQTLEAEPGTGTEIETEEETEPKAEEEETEPEAEERKNESAEVSGGPNGTGQMFTGLDIKMKEGNLSISVGESFSVCYRNEETTDYEIVDGMLYFKNRESGDVAITLPVGEVYESMILNVKDGHAYVGGAVTVRTLVLEAERSDVQMDGICVSESCSIDAEQGKVYLSGDLGASVTADCRQGQMAFLISPEKTYNYELDAVEGKIYVEGKEYHGRRISDTIDNGSEQRMKLSCSKGDISVESETVYLPNPEQEKGESL